MATYYSVWWQAEDNDNKERNLLAGKVQMCIPRRGSDSFRTKQIILPLVSFYEKRGGRRGSCGEACSLICSHQECKIDYAVSSDGNTCSCMRNSGDLCPGPEDVCAEDVCYDTKFIVDGNLMEAIDFTILEGGSVHVFGEVGLGSGQDRILLKGVDAKLDVVPCPTCKWYERHYSMQNNYNTTASGMDSEAPGVKDL